MLKLYVVDCYSPLFDDIYTYFLSQEKIILQGDYYHNKIHDKIDGFLEGLSFAAQDFKLSRHKLNFQYIEDALGLEHKYLLNKVNEI